MVEVYITVLDVYVVWQCVCGDQRCSFLTRNMRTARLFEKTVYESRVLECVTVFWACFHGLYLTENNKAFPRKDILPNQSADVVLRERLPASMSFGNRCDPKLMGLYGSQMETWVLYGFYVGMLVRC